MWIIELNIAGQRFTHRFADPRRQPAWSARFTRPNLHWRAPQLRQQHAA